MPHAHNVELVGYHDLAGRPGFKLAMQEVDGRFYLYVTSLWEPGLTILDVTNPREPELARWLPGPPNTWTLQVQVADGRMITALEHIPAGQGWVPAGTEASEPPQDGFLIWDVRDPVDPRLVGQWRTGAKGTHRNFYAGGSYVYAAASLPGYVGRIYAAVDISDPATPRLAGTWALPGQHAGAGERFADADERLRTAGRPYPNEAISLHGPPYVEGDRAYCPWGRGGLVTLDVSDVSRPELVSVFRPYPPLGSSLAMHTAIPLTDRNLVLVNDEALNEKRGDPLNFAGIVDVSEETDPVLVSLFPLPEPPSGLDHGFFLRGGRFGPHNQHHPQGHPTLAPIENLTYLTYFNAGLQIVDIGDPLWPRIVGSYIPDDPVQRFGPLPTDLVTQAEDVLVDRRQVIYLTEKNSGIHILEFTGE